MLYAIYCNLTETYVCSRIHHGGQYSFYFGKELDNKKRCFSICCKTKRGKGETYTNKNHVEELLHRLNSIVPNAFEIHTWSLKEA